MNRGALGVRELNAVAAERAEPGAAERAVVERFGWQFRAGDKVIQTENNYDKDVFNGDIGQIVKIDPVEREVLVAFDAREVVYDSANWTRSRSPTRSRSTSPRGPSFRRW